MAELQRSADGKVGSVLTGQQIQALLEAEPPLAAGLKAPSLQVQPNGLDLTVASVWRLRGAGKLGLAEDDREIPSRELLSFQPDGLLTLETGSYVVLFNETVQFPPEVMALGRPRSSLLRGGCSLHTAVWDAGYRGRSESLLVVHNPHGYVLARDARICQLVFFRLTERSEGYAGRYQGENTA